MEKNIKKSITLLTTGVLLTSNIAPSLVSAAEQSTSTSDSDKSSATLSSPPASNTPAREIGDNTFETTNQADNSSSSSILTPDSTTSDKSYVSKEQTNSTIKEKVTIEKDKISTTSSQKENIAKSASGKFGTSDWTLDEAGTLTIKSGKFDDVSNGNGPWYTYSDKVKKIVFDGSVTAGSNCSNLFYEFENLTEIDNLVNFNTSNVTSMKQMFAYCSSLTKLDLSNFNTSNVTNMGHMFEECSSLTNLDISNFNTASVTNMGGMFYQCSSLTNLDISNFNTASVTNMGDMFAGCSGITILDVSNFDTAKVVSMVDMFSSCYSLSSLNINNFNTSNVMDMSAMFAGCEGLTTLDVSNFDTTNVTDMAMLFYGCKGLTSVNMNNFNTANVTDMEGMFAQCYTLNQLVLGNKFTFKVSERGDASLQPLSIDGKYTGKWQNVGATGTNEQPAGDNVWTSDEFMANYNGDKDADTYVRQPVTPNPVKAEDVTVKYQDEDGNSLVGKDITLTGNVGETYTSEAKIFKGYTLKATPYNATGKFTDKAQTVTYVYMKNPVKAADVTVKYIDESGNSLVDKDIVLSGNIGETYTSEAKTFKGYTLKATPDNAKGEFTDKTQTVTYVYTKNPVKAADVTVKYIDESGNSLVDKDIVLSGNIGETYTSEAKIFDGYTLKTIPDNAKGEFTDKSQMVTYVYTKNPVKAADVIVKYVDELGNSLVDKDIVLSGNIGETYTSEAKPFDGYALKTTPDNAKGIFTEKVQTVIYVYTKSESPAPKPTPTPSNDDVKPTSKPSNSTNVDSTDSLPSTGENNNLSLYATMLGFITMALTSIVVFFKTKKKD